MKNIVRTSVEAIPIHEILFVFKDGVTGLNKFLDALQACIGIDHREVTEDNIYIRLKMHYGNKNDFLSVLREFMNNGKFNTHLFSKTLVAQTLCRMVGYSPSAWNRGGIYKEDCKEKHFKTLQRFLI